MKTMFKILALITLVVSASADIQAQRKVTPVEVKKTAISTLKGKEEAKKLLDKKIDPMLLFGDSIIADSIINPVDTVKKEKMKFPLLNGFTLGVNIWDPLMRIFNQKYGLVDFSAELNMHNRFFPIIELGLGMADNKPDDMNFRYKSPLSFYGKIGASYNFLYNKNPDYQFLAGFRLGYTSFKYDITEITLNSDYWGSTENIEILDQKSHALWIEVALGLRVKIVDNLSMGWHFKFHHLFNVKENINSSPWYIPGYGHRDRSVTGSFSIYYTIPLGKKKSAKTAEGIAPSEDISATPAIEPTSEATK